MSIAGIIVWTNGKTIALSNVQCSMAMYYTEQYLHEGAWSFK
jgi:hypothetical protein